MAQNIDLYYYFHNFIIVLRYLNLVSEHQVDHIDDKLFVATKTINQHINEDHYLAHLWQITIGLVLDSNFAILWYVFIVDSKSYRIFVTTWLFYGIRGLLQQLQTLPSPTGMFWEYPGFPSFVTSYGSQQTDFFYSGHIGFCVIWVIGF